MTGRVLQMLTKSTIDRAAPGSAPFVLWDNELGGFGCKVHPTGKRSFVVQYRRPGSRRLYQFTLGAYGVLTVTEARSAARRLLAAVRLGGDPMAERRAALSALTVTELVKQYSAALKAGTASSKRLRGRAASPAYLKDTLLHLERFGSACGLLPAGSVVRADVVSLLDRYVGRPAMHRRMHGAIRRMYAWAQASELVTNAPAERFCSSMVPGPTLRAGTESSTFCSRTATTFERCRIRFAALRRTPPSSQRTSKSFLDRWFSSGTRTGAQSSASRPRMRRT
jgi:hypothetical protein